MVVESVESRSQGADSTRRRARWPWVLGGVLLLLLAGYAGAAWALQGRVPSGVSVDGVQVGGLDRDAAVEKVLAQVGPRAAEPVPVTVGDAEDAVDPASAGLSVDVEGTVEGLVGFSLDPRSLWRHVSGSDEVESDQQVDEDRLRAAVEGLAGRVDAEVAEGAVAFADGAVVVTDARQGRVLDVDGTVEVLSEGWWTQERPLAVPARVTEPAVDATDVAEAVASFATPATAGPLTVAVGERTVELPPAVVTTAIRMDAVDGELVPAVDGEVLTAALLEAAPDVAVQPKDATFSFDGGRPTVVPAVTGLTVDPAALAASALTALTTPERVAAVEAVVAEPELTTAEAQALGIVEVVSEFSTNLTPDAGRTENITIAARAVDGTVLLPGETFSLNGTLGRRTPEKGYNEAPVIVGGRLTRDFGGGVSQVATTLFNGMYFAGLEDVEHRPHSFYISRYPEGREATVNFGSIDLRFRNDSPHGVYIQMYVSGGQVHTRFWSTKVWQIESEKGPRRNIKEPGSIRDSGPDCVNQSPQQGFDVTVTRRFIKDGSLVRSESFNTRYNAEDEVICG